MVAWPLSHSLVVGVQNGTATLGDSLEVSLKNKTYSYYTFQPLWSLAFTQMKV